ncbi:hypothetical protein [Serratia proteamaculans]|uniref:hypothetical protein n=1 Tax=Serratia proteamaculans TaxID=28151 RepID=UPI0039AF1096
MKASGQHAEKWRGVPPSNGLKGGGKLKKCRILTTENLIDGIDALIAARKSFSGLT